MKDRTAQGLPFVDSKIRCSHFLGNISTDAIDAFTWDKIKNLQDSQLENTVIARLLDYGGSLPTFEHTVEMARKDIAADAELRLATQKIYADSQKAIAVDKARIATDQAEKAREDQLETRRQIDSQITRLKEANKPPPIEPHVIERTFCGFCEEFHATRILLPCEKTREFPLSTWHVQDYMKTDSEGWETREASNLDRCVYALTVDKGLSQQDAETKCDSILSDPMFLHNFINFPVKTTVTKPSKEDLFIGKAVADMNIHPELAQKMYQKDRTENAEYISKLMETGELHKILARRKH